VRIRFGAGEYPNTLRFGNNSMDKLNLPAPGTEGPASYDDTTLLFTRIPDAGGASYQLTVGTAAQIATWRRASERRGTDYAMQGGRRWGVF
jgi:hypothetical protein